MKDQAECCRVGRFLFTVSARLASFLEAVFSPSGPSWVLLVKEVL